MDTATIIIAIVSALTSGGGVAAYLRARGQNRVDMLTALGERCARLEERNDAQDKRNDELARLNADKLGRIASLERDRETLNERLGIQRQLLDEQSVKLAMLAEREEENAQLRQQLQIEISKREFLQREIDSLREQIRALLTEIERLRARIPAEATDAD